MAHNSSFKNKNIFSLHFQLTSAPRDKVKLVLHSLRVKPTGSVGKVTRTSSEMQNGTGSRLETTAENAAWI